MRYREITKKGRCVLRLKRERKKGTGGKKENAVPGRTPERSAAALRCLSGVLRRANKKKDDLKKKEGGAESLLVNRLIARKSKHWLELQRKKKTAGKDATRRGRKLNVLATMKGKEMSVAEAEGKREVRRTRTSRS